MVYFIQFEEGGPIKIGSSDHILARLKHHEKTRGIRAILGVHDGDRETERAVHRRFAHLKIAKTRRLVGKNAMELFEPAPDLLGYIADHCEELELQEGALSPRALHTDLAPAAHEALRREALSLNLTVASLARRIISERYGIAEA